MKKTEGNEGNKESVEKIILCFTETFEQERGVYAASTCKFTLVWSLQALLSFRMAAARSQSRESQQCIVSVLFLSFVCFCFSGTVSIQRRIT